MCNIHWYSQDDLNMCFLTPNCRPLKVIRSPSSDRFGEYMGSTKFYEIPRELPSRGGVCRWQGEAINLKNGD